MRRARVRLARGALVTLLLAPAAGAQTASTVAESLFADGKALMDQGRYEQACPKLAESQRLDPGGGTLLNLATCYEKWGKTATAWSHFKTALAQARKDGRTDREQLALGRIQALEPTLARMTVTVPEPARVDGLVVEVDGSELGSAAWGTALPVDPGTHAIAARAPGKKPWSADLDVRAQQTHSVTVPVLEGDASATAVPSPTRAPPAAAPAPGVRADTADGSGQRTLGWIVTAVGGVGLAAGGFFGLQAISRRSDADDECPADACSDEGRQLDEDAKQAATLSNVAFGVGVVGVGVGLYLVLSAPSGPEQAARGGARPTAVRLTPRAAPGAAGLTISGSF